jgi:SprT protein
MQSLRQLEFVFERSSVHPLSTHHTVVGQALRLPGETTATGTVALELRRRAEDLEAQACELLRSLGATGIATGLRVEWNSRLQTAAGRADYRQKLISLNPRLVEHPAEIDRTLRHELAHILAQFRAGRRRISPHGAEWRQACRDVGIANEKRCHTLPFRARRFRRRFIYRCPHCGQDFPRVRKLKRTVACLTCCRAHSGGEFDVRFRLQLKRA